MQPSYDLELSPESKSLLLLRFRLGCVDWLSVENHAERAELIDRLDAPVRAISGVFDAAWKMRWSLKVEPLQSQSRAIAAASLWLVESRGERPGARSRAEREAIWHAQASAARRFEDDQNLKKVFRVLNRQDAMAEFSGAYEDAAKRRAYIEDGDLSAIDELLDLRIRLSNSLLKWARLTRRAGPSDESKTLLNLFQISFNRTPEEMMANSDLYRTLTARLMLDRARQTFMPNDSVIVIDAIITTADLPHRINAICGPLSLSPDTVSLQTMAALKTAANAGWAERVREDGQTLWLQQKRRIDNILRTSERITPSTSFKSKHRRDFQDELAWRWEQFKRFSAAGAVLTAEALAFVVRLHAMLILNFLQLIQAAGKDYRTYAPNVVEEYIIAYRNATSFLLEESHSLGAASHLRRFGSHAISQRTATRYNII